MLLSTIACLAGPEVNVSFDCASNGDDGMNMPKQKISAGTRPACLQSISRNTFIRNFTVRPMLKLIVLFFKNRKRLAVYKAEVFFCGLCDGGVGLRFSMMRVTDVNTYSASTSSASHTTIMVLYIVDPSVRNPIWFRFVEHCAWIALRIPIV